MFVPVLCFLLDGQDLAQDLPQDAVALELVLDRVREHDSTVSNEQARNILVSCSPPSASPNPDLLLVVPTGITVVLC